MALCSQQLFFHKQVTVTTHSGSSLMKPTCLLPQGNSHSFLLTVLT